MRVALLIALVALSGCSNCGDRREGSPRRVWLMPAGDSDSLVLFDSLSGKGHTVRMIAVDVATGSETGLRTFSDVWSGERCAPASPGRMWCELQRLAIHDVRTLATIAHAGDLVAKSGLGRPAPDRAYLDGGDAVIVLEDGRKARIDAVTLAVTLDPSAVTGEWGSALLGCGVGGTHIGLGALSFGQGERTPLLFNGVATGVDFLEPELLVRTGDLAIIRHESLLDRERSHLLLTAVDAQGARRWDADLGRVDCEVATMAQGLVVITTYSRSSRAFGVDPATGAIRWRYGL